MASGATSSSRFPASINVSIIICCGLQPPSVWWKCTWLVCVDQQNAAAINGMGDQDAGPCNMKHAEENSIPDSAIKARSIKCNFHVCETTNCLLGDLARRGSLFAYILQIFSRPEHKTNFKKRKKTGIHPQPRGNIPWNPLLTWQRTWIRGGRTQLFCFMKRRRWKSIVLHQRGSLRSQLTEVPILWLS